MSIREVDADLIVVGGGMAGLVIAHDVARAGVRVILLDAADRTGGLLRRGTVSGIDIDLGAESFATRTDAVPSLIADAGLDLRVVTPRPGGAMLAVGTPDGVIRAHLPRRAVLGIPADPWAADVVAIIGDEGARRAAQEPTLPRGSGPEPSLFDLVAARSGPRVAERLVEPLCRSVYSRSATDVALSSLHPALWAEFARLGSLTAAVAALATTQRAGSAVAGIDGGMWRLPVALERAARAHGADIRTDIAVTSLEGAVGAASLTVHTPRRPLRARRVVVATGSAAAARLREGAHPREVSVGAVDADRRVRLVAAAIAHPAFDDSPVGSGVIVDPALNTAAKALTHTTAKWEWARAAAAGLHLFRLSARHADAEGLATAADVAREVSALTGIQVAPSDVVDVVSQTWTDAVASHGAASQTDAGARRDDVRADAAARGIHHAGADAAGTGLASVIPHARALAAELIDLLTPTQISLSTRSTP